MRRLLLVSAAVLLSAAGPAKSFLTVTPLQEFDGLAARPAKKPAVPLPGGFTAAPTPNQDAQPPAAAKQSEEASLSPGFFQRGNHGQGEGYLPSSSFQSEANSKARPGAGLNLSMPLQ